MGKREIDSVKLARIIKQHAIDKWTYISNSGDYTIYDIMQQLPHLKYYSLQCSFCTAFRCTGCPLYLHDGHGDEFLTKCCSTFYNWVHKKNVSSATAMVSAILLVPVDDIVKAIDEMDQDTVLLRCKPIIDNCPDILM